MCLKNEEIRGYSMRSEEKSVYIYIYIYIHTTNTLRSGRLLELLYKQSKASMVLVMLMAVEKSSSSSIKKGRMT